MEKLELKVAGMTCGGCEASITRALQRIGGVSTVEASHERGAVVVEAERALDRDEVVRAIEDAGYEVLPDGGRSLHILG